MASLDNGTYLAAKSLGWTTIDVVRTTLEGLDAAAFAIADNRTSDLSTFDDASLAKLLVELRTEDALEGVGFDSGEIDELLASLDGLDEPGLIDDPGAGDPPTNPVSRLGDLWLLGGHRLLCGDSTKPDDLARLMAGEKASLLATDPPYLVDYDGTNHPAEHHKKAGRTSSPGKEVGNKRWDGPTRLARMLALAHYVERLVEAGELAGYAEAARVLGLTRARLTQVMSLKLLAPKEQELVLVGACAAREWQARASVRTPVWSQRSASLLVERSSAPSSKTKKAPCSLSLTVAVWSSGLGARSPTSQWNPPDRLASEGVLTLMESQGERRYHKPQAHLRDSSHEAH